MRVVHCKKEKDERKINMKIGNVEFINCVDEDNGRPANTQNTSSGAQTGD